MKKLHLLCALASILSLGLISSCSQETTKEEKIEINTMDSTAAQAKEAREKLEEQTKKVEASIEEVDKEFDNDK